MDMVNRSRRHGRPGRREFQMTGVAHITGGKVLCALTACGATVMTTYTVTAKGRVIRRDTARHQPVIGIMTNITLIVSGNVIGPFTRGERAIMAG